MKRTAKEPQHGEPRTRETPLPLEPKPKRWLFTNGASAQEAGRRGGIASGESRRNKASLRNELQALLSVEDGAVCKSIVLAIAREAKNGNVGAFKAIASVLGEMMPDTAVAINAPPLVIAPIDPAWVAAERERQKRAAAELDDELGGTIPPPGSTSQDFRDGTG